MKSYQSLLALMSTALILPSSAHRVPNYKHEAVNVANKRQVGPPMSAPESVSASAASDGVLTMITPSPSASPVAVTEQSQIVSSYVPQFTLCELPPLAFFSLSMAPSASPVTAPYRNYSISTPPGKGTCTTIYSATETMVCATVLSDLVSKYTVTNCDQELTFSTQFGYVLATPSPTMNATLNGTYAYSNASAAITPAPTVQTLTTYYLAPWQELTSAGPPGDVDLKVCTTYENGTRECIREYQIWETTLATITATSTIALNFTTTISGPSQIIVETFVANVTENVTTFSMETTIEKEYQTETESLTVSTRAPSTTGPTVFTTKTVSEASETASPDITSTSTVHLTSTIYAGTTTVTLPDGQTAPSSSSGPDFASMLGVGK